MSDDEEPKSDEELKRDIVADLKKTGYPTEIVAASTLKHQGWSVLHNPSYLDDVENKNRELDLRAYLPFPTHGPSGQLPLEVYMLTSCKKSGNPWVFFVTEQAFSGVTLGKSIKVRSEPDNIFYSESADRPPIVSPEDLWRLHHYFGETRTVVVGQPKPPQIGVTLGRDWARTYHEPFKSKGTSGSSPMILGAVSSAMKATLFHMREKDEGKGVLESASVVLSSRGIQRQLARGASKPE